MKVYLLAFTVAVAVCCSIALCDAQDDASFGLTAEAIDEYYRLTATGENVGGSALAPSSSSNVEIVVNSSLYASGQVTAGLNQYMQDISTQGYNPILTTSSFADAAALRTHLQGRYQNQGLAGAVFVGNLPTATFEIAAHKDWDYESFPCDYYFQDLDGIWSDSDGDSLLDMHSAALATPEIFVGRLVTNTLTGRPGRTEAGMLNSYFAKNHSYRTRQLTLSNNGLAYIDDDWSGWAAQWSGNLQTAVGGTVTMVRDGATTIASDYKNRLQTEYEHVLLAAHSSSTSHSFKIGSEWTGGTIHTSELRGLDPQVLFYNLYACSNARYISYGYMAGEYVFGTDKGLLAVGSTKVGSMLKFDDYFAPLGDGETFGEAWKNWWWARTRYGPNQSVLDWHYGMTMIGDPLLLTQEHMPEPLLLAIIDIKPGSDVNPVNLKSKGVLPVVIIGAEDFDVNQIDLSTATLDGASPRTKGSSGDVGSFEDINGDLIVDLILHFDMRDMNIDPLASTLILTGELFDGTAFEGSDAIRIVPPGDMDGDGLLTSDDIGLFVLALADGDAYLAAYGLPANIPGDCDGDGVLTADDIHSFVDLLTGRVGSAIPEPAMLAMLAFGAAVLLRRRQR